MAATVAFTRRWARGDTQEETDSQQLVFIRAASRAWAMTVRARIRAWRKQAALRGSSTIILTFYHSGRPRKRVERVPRLRRVYEQRKSSSIRGSTRGVLRHCRRASHHRHRGKSTFDNRHFCADLTRRLYHRPSRLAPQIEAIRRGWQ